MTVRLEGGFTICFFAHVLWAFSGMSLTGCQSHCHLAQMQAMTTKRAARGKVNSTRSLPRRDRVTHDGSRFRLVTFSNRGGTESFRVVGWTRTRQRIRENFPDRKSAKLRQLELEAEYHATRPVEVPRVTTLSHAHLRAAEAAFSIIGADADPDEIIRGIRFWMDHGRNLVGPEDAPCLDDARTGFEKWLATDSGLRPKTQTGLRHALRQLVRSLGNRKLSDMTGDVLHDHISTRPVSRVAKDNERRALSRFFAWCMERPRQWIRVNPCSTVRTRRKHEETPPPAILTVPEVETLLRAAESHAPDLLPWFTLQLFGCLRPAEAQRLEWSQVNFKDREIRLEASQTKTGKPRVLPIHKTLAAWLKASGTSNLGFSRRRFREVVRAAGIKDWTQDVLRHTGISHLVRLRDSFAEVAIIAGNSEQMIRRHYLGRTTTEETSQFFALRPGNGGGE